MFEVFVTGSSQARERWGKRIYKHRQSAKRRVREIQSAHDLGVGSIWLAKEREPNQFLVDVYE